MATSKTSSCRSRAQYHTRPTIAPRSSLEGLRRAPAHGATTPISAGFSEGCGHRGVFSAKAVGGAIRAPSVGHRVVLRLGALEVGHAEVVRAGRLEGGDALVP